jgi:uncharacterized protein YegL
MDQNQVLSEKNTTKPLVPVFLVLEESSMMSDAQVGVLNEVLEESVLSFFADPIAFDRFHVEIITYSSSPVVLLPLVCLADVGTCPGLVRGDELPDYASVFRKIKQRIDEHVPHQRMKRTVMRPVVFFVCSGQPTDSSWRIAFSELVDITYKFSPNLVHLGFDEAQKEFMDEIAYSRFGHRQYSLIDSTSVDPKLLGELLFRVLCGSYLQARVFDAREDLSLSVEFLVVLDYQCM